MTIPDRRTLLASAAALGATLALASPSASASNQRWTERRDLYPEGVASGDPEPTSVILWTRRPYDDGRANAALQVEIAEDEAFRRVVASARANISPASDWTGRVLVGGLKPDHVYWYRFIDSGGGGSRIGRTITAPTDEDARTVRFAFVSCQSVNEGAQNAYRRMIWEDQRAASEMRLNFVLHLGDFIYEVVEYPDEVSHRYDRTVYDIGRIPDGRKVTNNLHVPTTLEGYRMVYKAHIRDPDVQDARAWFPFVCIGDNHEFSWQGWQSFIKYGGKTEPAQALRVAANQAFWEFIPSRVRKAGAAPETFDAPPVETVPITRFDEDGLGDEPNNHAALASMTGYRAVRYGRHVELILTDFHSYAMEDPGSKVEASALVNKAFPELYPQETMEMLDAGRTGDGGSPPEYLEIGDKRIPNFTRNDPPVTVMGRVQKAWLKQTLAASTATWKVWGATNGTLDMRTDPQNLPVSLNAPWPGKGYATFGGGDFSGAFLERAEVYDFVRDQKISGFTIVSGDRHSFWAGYAAGALPPQKYEPVGLAFICGSLSAPGLAEALQHALKTHPLSALYVSEREPGRPEATVNLTVKHGVNTALEYARSGDIEAAHRLSNPDNAPHVDFVDLGGHGYAVVTAGLETFVTEFVCIPRPITRATTPDGGPLRYRVRHTASMWKPGERPRMRRDIVDGDVTLSI